MLKNLSGKLPTSIYFVLGGPGSGKGTQCELLQRRLNYCHLSAGELLRNVPVESQYTNTINTCINDGKIVPSYITISLLNAAIQANKDLHTQFLIDGFPRNTENLNSWLAQFDTTQYLFRKVIHLVCTEAEMVNRIKHRLTYSGRSDDDLEILKKRFQTYRENTQEIIEYHRVRNLLVEINGNRSVEEIYSEIVNKINT